MIVCLLLYRPTPTWIFKHCREDDKDVTIVTSNYKGNYTDDATACLVHHSWTVTLTPSMISTAEFVLEWPWRAVVLPELPLKISMLLTTSSKNKAVSVRVLFWSVHFPHLVIVLESNWPKLYMCRMKYLLFVDIADDYYVPQEIILFLIKPSWELGDVFFWLPCSVEVFYRSCGIFVVCWHHLRSRWLM